ncbi:unnamed protein product [Bursaphelenchus okinawaensis]|uniref:Peptidase A1 domain-containing protein n=1 Tax=Bursaphelenchus okinawaensis TaxID=465554 RepID=A0A811LK24_9BILA|nr:unnamed protein product [Bursaphelenchus okinawaensis]CAG9125135.1 unnamed protein product [Bursaphelenchus okinawaensis]
MKSLIFCLLIVATTTCFEIPVKRVVKSKEAAVNGVPLDKETGSFVGVVSLGTPGQDFNLAFSTNTSALWVPNTSCSCGEKCKNARLCPQLCEAHCCSKSALSNSSGSCSNKNTFNVEESRSFIAVDETANIPFLDSNLTAQLGYDTLRMGPHYRPGLTANNIQFGVVNEFEGQYQDVTYDGIFGLGLESVEGVSSPIKQLYSTGVIPSPLLSAFFVARTENNVVDGVLTLGQEDTTRCKKSNHFFNVEDNWGTIDLSSDYIYVPREVLQVVASFFDSKIDIITGRVAVNCNRNTYLYFTVGGTYSRVFSNQIMEPYSGAQCLLKLKVSPVDAPVQYKFGLPLFTNNCLVLDFNGKMAVPEKND